MINLSVYKIGRAGAPRILCLHGWGFDARCFQPLAELLGDQFECVMPDLPGFGASPGANAGDAQAWCEFALKVVAEVLAPAPAHLLGWSLGGQLALALADHPQVRSVTAIASNLQFRTDERWPCAMPAQVYQQFCENFERAPAPTLRRFYGLVAEGGAITGREVQQQWAAQLPLSGNDWQLALQALSWLDLRDRLFTVPTQLLLAERDALVPVDLVDTLAARADLHCHQLPGGHQLPLSQAAGLAPIIREFCHGA